MNRLHLRAPARRFLLLVIASLLIAGVAGAGVVERGPQEVAVRADSPGTSAPEPSVVADTQVETTTSLLAELTPTTAAPKSTATTTKRSSTPVTTKPVEVPSHPPLMGKSGLYIASTDGGPLRQLVAGTNVVHMGWSADGEQLAYVVDGQVWVVPADGGPARTVSPKNHLAIDPAWSPSGKYLAYIASPGDGTGPSEARVVDLGTGNERVLGLGNFGYAPSIAWSPKGETVAYFDHAGHLVVHDLLAGTSAATSSYMGGAPIAWSPKGDALAFRYQQGLGVLPFNGVAKLNETFLTVRLETWGLVDPVWVGDDVYYVNPWVLDAIRRDGQNQRRVVSDYVGWLGASPERPNDLFIAVCPDTERTEVRRIERVGLDGSVRKVLVEPLPGHNMHAFEVSPQGDRLGVIMVIAEG